MNLLTPTKHLDKNITISIFDIKELNENVRKLLDTYFILICEGDSGSELLTVKRRIRNLFNGKNDTWIYGATAEFFIHLYINLEGYKQECLFMNLEENSIKKGFDGFYSKNKTTWIMESKSGSITTSGVSHTSKVLEAMRDLQDKVEGNTANNPWANAYSHASHVDVGTTKELRKQIQQLSTDFIDRQFYTLEKFNTMPSGTVFLSGIWANQDHKKIINNILKNKNKLIGENVHVICVTHSSHTVIQKYISED